MADSTASHLKVDPSYVLARTEADAVNAAGVAGGCFEVNTLTPF